MNSSLFVGQRSSLVYIKQTQIICNEKKCYNASIIIAFKKLYFILRAFDRAVKTGSHSRDLFTLYSIKLDFVKATPAAAHRATRYAPRHTYSYSLARASSRQRGAARPSAAQRGQIGSAVKRSERAGSVLVAKARSSALRPSWTRSGQTDAGLCR